jgi:hypothetical protein
MMLRENLVTQLGDRTLHALVAGDGLLILHLWAPASNRLSILSYRHFQERIRNKNVFSHIFYFLLWKLRLDYECVN